MARMFDTDILVVGGGINGCGIARDAAGRGHRVTLAEMNDLASGTSSWSTKLIHGGLRYLEQYDFRLVRHALQEREVLLGIAPHIIRPLRFVLPHHRAMRPAWMLRAGLFLYDHLAGRRQLAGSTSVDLSGPLGAPLKPEFKRGFEYSDARVDDARLVTLNARDAAHRGARILTRTRVRRARRDAGGWVVDLVDTASGHMSSLSARALVNASGPWIDEVSAETLGDTRSGRVRLVKGSHIVTRRLYEHDRAYIFQNGDGRIVFTIPYEDDFTLIGTTDIDYRGDPGAAAIDEDEIAYLLAATGAYLERPAQRDDVVWSFSGVRPLFDDGAGKAQESSRDYVLSLDRGSGDEAPLLSVYGGKITTYRVLADGALDRLESAIGRPVDGLARGWTGTMPLPGGDFDAAERGALEKRAQARWPGIAPRTAKRLVTAYGTDALRIAETPPGPDFGHGLYHAEVDWLMANEWAMSSEDILWRRSKLGLHFTADQVDALDTYLDRRLQRHAAAE